MRAARPFSADRWMQTAAATRLICMQCVLHRLVWPFVVLALKVSVGVVIVIIVMHRRNSTRGGHVQKKHQGSRSISSSQKKTKEPKPAAKEQAKPSQADVPIA